MYNRNETIIYNNNNNNVKWSFIKSILMSYNPEGSDKCLEPMLECENSRNNNN